MNKFVKWGLIVVGGGVFLCLSLAVIVALTDDGSEVAIVEEVGTDQEPEESQPQEEPTAQPEPTTAPQPEQVDFEKLVSDFDSNQLKAEKEYTGRFVTMTGWTQNISEDILGKAYVTFRPVEDSLYFGATVQCYPATVDDLLLLENDTQQAFTGVVGEMTIGIVGMKECTFSE